MQTFYHQKQAFTLAEMLVVIVILGIISAFAIPGYTKYIVRSRVQAMYDAATAAKFIVTDDYSNQGTFPTYASKATPFTTSKADYISSIDITKGRITITGVAAKLYNKEINLTLQPTAQSPQQVSWQCCVSSPDFFDYAPAECRYEMTACPNT
jgi:prepilin-type N-terminal cleavage/methylation domain-containing protein